MSAPFTPAQESRIADIMRGIVGEVLMGADARIRDAIGVGQMEKSQAVSPDAVSSEPFTVDQQRAVDRRIGDLLIQFQGEAALRAWSAFCDASPRPVTVWSAPVPQRGEQ